MQFSEFQIDHIIESVNLAWKHNQIPNNGKQEFLTTLKTYISQSGIDEGVCHRCLGTGKDNVE